MSSPSASRGWFWAAVLLTVAKLWLVTGQRVFAIGPSFHDDRLFLELAGHILSGQWLGPYTELTLAKGPMYSIFIAAVFKLGVPLAFAQHLLYAAACATVTRSLSPWLRSGAAGFALYALLLWNPMSYEAEFLTRVLRQNLYTPLGLFTIAGLVTLFARRRDRAWRQAVTGAAAGLAFGCFWLTREESMWLLPAVGLLLVAPALGLACHRELAPRWRALVAGSGTFVVVAVLPLLAVCTMNLRHYGWFGSVEFRAPEFNDAYGALLRVQVGPKIKDVTVTRQMREAAYELSPAFARLRPALDGPVGTQWADPTVAPVSERQIRGGWFPWALRDAVRGAGVAANAREAMRFYRQVADELNAGCDAGRVPALPRRSGFLPPLGPELIRPIADDGVKFLDYFFRFRDFTAYALPSQGDYADLKPFRNFVGSRLTHAPRSPDLPTPEQDRRDSWKVDGLERIGQGLASLLSWLGPLLLLVGCARLVESAVNRRISFPLGLAGALLCSCLGYLAINVLIQVTSFYNMIPAALSAAYPLYLTALGAIAIDAVQAWRRTAPAGAAVDVAAPAPASAAVPRLVWLPAAGVALAVFGARLAEIHFYASDVPFHDQWVVEAQQMILPWLDGTLGPGAFFLPHFEHVPVWTRLLTWLQVVVTGRWDPLVQMTTNAALYAGFTWFVARWTWSVLSTLPAFAVTLLLLLAGALPHAWENITWGFQSQFPLALCAVVLHVHGCCTAPARSRCWWLAQAAGIAGLGTIASFWLAPLAVVLGWCWTGPRRRADLLAPGLIAAAGALALQVIHRTSGGAIPQGSSGFLESLLHLLAWPSLLPGAVAIVQLPWFIHALRLRNQAGTAPVDRIIFATGLFNLLQTAVLAFGRTADNTDFASRDGELLFLGTLAGALALARVVPRHGPGHSRLLALATLWSIVVVTGLVRNSIEGSARNFHTYAAENATVRRAAVQACLADGNQTLLETPAARAVLSNDPALVARLLGEPKFSALLPASVNPASAPDWAGGFVRNLQARWGPLLGGGVLLMLAGIGTAMWRRRADPLAPLPVVPDPWRGRIAAAIGGVALVATLSWSNPFSFDAGGRWQRWLGGKDALRGLTFAFASPSPFEAGRLQGAAPIQPEVLRNYFYGTAPEGPGFTGTVVSSPFTITTPWLIVPYAGYPVGHGNGLRIRLLDEQGNPAGGELGCDGPNVDSIAYWTVDVRAHRGRRACLVLYDGRTETQAWVAASPPIPADRPELAAQLARGLQGESHFGMRIAVALIALVSLGCAAMGWRAGRAPTAPS